MEKYDLNNFDLVELRCGTKYLIVDNNMYDSDGGSICDGSLDYYKNDLTDIENDPTVDIVRVWKHKPEANCIVFTTKDRTPDWDREESDKCIGCNKDEKEYEHTTGIYDPNKYTCEENCITDDEVKQWNEEDRISRKLCKKFNKILDLHDKLTELYDSESFDNREEVEKLQVKLEKQLNKSLKLRYKLNKNKI